MKVGPGRYEETTEWIETWFFQSWHFGDPNSDEEEQIKKADLDWDAAHSSEPKP